MRMDPPPSPAEAKGTIPAEIADAEPPLDPPGVWSLFHGLRQGPKTSGSVIPNRPNSGVFVLPTMTTPACLNRDTNSLS